MQSVFTSRDVQDATGLSQRQLDHYARTGLVPASVAEADGHGTRRLYAPHDVLALVVLVELKKAGITGSPAARAVGLVRGSGEELSALAAKCLVFCDDEVNLKQASPRRHEPAARAGACWQLPLRLLADRAMGLRTENRRAPNRPEQGHP